MVFSSRRISSISRQGGETVIRTQKKKEKKIIYISILSILEIKGGVAFKRRRNIVKNKNLYLCFNLTKYFYFFVYSFNNL